jgi:PAS domain S-box-containing protein
VLRGESQIERLKVSLVGWLDRLLAGPWDHNYYELRSRIGRVHVKVRLPQRYMFTAMALIRLHLLGIARASFPDDSQQLHTVICALSRVIDLELAIMLQTYREDSLANLRRLERVEKHILERRLEITEERYQAIVQSAAVLVIVLDDELHIALFNSAAERVSGYSREDLAGANFVDLLCHPQDAGDTKPRLRRALVGETTPPFESRMVASSGEIRWLRWHLAPLPAQGLHQICAIGVDVSEERKLADEGRRAETLASLGALAAGLAHEIRNPLNAAQLQLTLVDRRLEKDPGSARASASLVRDELRRLAGLVEDFLAFARPSELRVRPADLCATIRTTVSLIEPQSEQHGVTLVVDLPDAPIAARFDEERIKQVLINLIRNGIEAAGSGGRVTVGVSRFADIVAIEVIDTGPGLQDDVNIFEPFRTTKDQGTGLGLPIVHRIVTDHQGVISVGRRADETVFTIDLPIDGPV